MIKRFKEYIKENASVFDILPKQEIEDQFLRLKEVLGNASAIYKYNGSFSEEGYYQIVVEDVLGNEGRGEYAYKETINPTYSEEVFEELKTIRNRIEYMFPSLKMIVYNSGPSHYLSVFIFKKEKIDIFLNRIKRQKNSNIIIY